MTTPGPGCPRGVCTAFNGSRRLAHGPLAAVVAAAKAAFDRSRTSAVLVFEDATGDLIDVDYSGTPAAVLRVLTARESRGWPTRPTPCRAAPDGHRRAQDVTYRFTSALAGDLPGFEEAIRALFGGDAARFAEHTRAWPRDVRTYAQQLAAPALGATA